MGIVLAYAAKSEAGKKSQKPHQGQSHGPCEIVIFPGVRIERRDFTDEEAMHLKPMARVRNNSRRRERAKQKREA